MTPQDFKALLDALKGIQRAIELKAGSSPEKVVNRFAEVFRLLQELQKTLSMSNAPIEGEELTALREAVTAIVKLYAKTAEEVLNE